MDWQPIETAPKDGTAILAYGPSPQLGGLLSQSPYSDSAHPNIAVISWYSHEYDTFEDTGDGLYRKVPMATEGWRGGSGIRPTHWMPLPAPPASVDTLPKGQDAEERLDAEQG